MNSKQIIVAVVVALLLAVAVGFGPSAVRSVSSALGASPGGAVHNTPDFWVNGIGIGNQVRIVQSGTIGAGMNQGYWKNNTGRTVIVNSAEIGFSSGVASSSFTAYVATSTASALTNDFARPSGFPLIIDGTAMATGTGTGYRISTTTSAGVGPVQVPANAYLIFQIQSTGGCKTVGGCETATSTNRGITNWLWYFSGRYIP